MVPVADAADGGGGAGPLVCSSRDGEARDDLGDGRDEDVGGRDEAVGGRDEDGDGDEE